MSSYLDAIISCISDEWATPSPIYKWFVYHRYYDPCPLGGSDALDTKWADFNFVNPPYSCLASFAQKSIYEMRQGRFVVLLVPLRPSTSWFRSLLDAGATVACCGRLKFGKALHKAPFESCFVVLSPFQTWLRHCFIPNDHIIAWLDANLPSGGSLSVL